MLDSWAPGILQRIPRLRYCYYNCIYESGKRLKSAYVSALPHSEEECSSTTARCQRSTCRKTTRKRAKSWWPYATDCSGRSIISQRYSSRGVGAVSQQCPQHKNRLTDESRHAFVGRESCSNSEHVLMVGAHASKSHTRQK